MTKTRLTWAADFLSDTTNKNHCSGFCMVLCVNATSVSEILFKFIKCVCKCECVFYVVVFCKHLQIENRKRREHHGCRLSSLPQVGNNRMTAEVGTALWTMTASRLVAGAQPQALDCSPGEAGEMPAWKKLHSSGWRRDSVRTKM